MQFEWDPVKNKSNIQKHGYGFDLAEEVLKKQVIFQESNRGEEKRWVVIGPLDQNQFVSIVLTFREGRIRIISIRRARDYEKRDYRAIYF